MIEGRRRIQTAASRAADQNQDAWLLGWVLLTVLTVAVIAGCAAYPDEQAQAHPVQRTSHNDAGGYRATCGELPGQMGDDC